MKKFTPTSDTPRRSAAFTLIELLVVIAIIAILAGMLFPITRAVNRAKIKSKAKVELAQVQSAIEAYKMKLGHYPPDNPASPMRNPLYYELTGTAAPAGVPWIQNTLNRSFAGEESARAVKFLTFTRRSQVGDLEGAQIIVCSVKSRMPDGTQAPSPFRYRATNPVYNQNSYDLWVDVVFEGKTNRFSNWSSAPVTVYEPGI